MGKTDVCTKEYMSNPRIFADAFNYYFSWQTGRKT